MDLATASRARPPAGSGDGGLVRAVLAGEQRAVADLVQRLCFVPRVLRAMNRRSSAPLAEPELDDAGQEALLAIWRKLPSFDGSVRLETWFYRFAQIEFLRSRRRRGEARRKLVESAPPPQASEPGPAHAWDLEALYASLERLPADERRIVDLKHFGGLTFERAAEQLEIPVNTAKSRYYRALRVLRRDLDRRLGDPQEGTGS